MVGDSTRIYFKMVVVYMYHSLLIHSSADGHLGCFHVLAIINSAAMNIGGTRVSFPSGFLSVYAQQWDCWIIRHVYCQDSVGEGEGGKIWENGIETCKISCMK